MSDITDSEILSIAYDLNAMPEQMTDKALYRFARAMILIGSQAQQERIATLEAVAKAAEDVFENEMIANPNREAALGTTLRAAGYLKEQGE